MTTDVKIPEDTWKEDEDAVITAWFVSDGGTVEKGALLAEIMVAKIQYEISAPASGTLSIVRAIDDVVAKGDVIGSIS